MGVYINLNGASIEQLEEFLNKKLDKNDLDVVFTREDVEIKCEQVSDDSVEIKLLYKGEPHTLGIYSPYLVDSLSVFRGVSYLLNQLYFNEICNLTMEE